MSSCRICHICVSLKQLAIYICYLTNNQNNISKEESKRKIVKQTNKHEKQKENKSKKIQSFHQSLVQRSFRHICHFYMVISHLQSAKYRLLV